jgi:hypothetical protein
MFASRNFTPYSCPSNHDSEGCEICIRTVELYSKEYLVEELAPQEHKFAVNAPWYVLTNRYSPHSQYG